MLGKLIKHEFKATSRWFLPIYVLALILAPIERITAALFETGIGRQLEGPWKNVAATAFVIITLAYALSLVASGVASLLLIVNRFYKNLTTNESYLMHTLPVKTSELIWSKAITAIIWTIISVFVICIAIIILVVGTEGWNDVMYLLPQMYTDFMSMYGSHINLGLLIVEFLVTVLSSGLHFIFMVYASIAIGQLFSKHKVGASIAAFLIIDTVVEFLTTIISIPTLNSIDFTDYQDFISMTTNFYLPASILITTIITAAFYFITWYIFKNKMNLE